MTETAKERMYREALEILRGMGINSNNRVMMPYGVAVTAQEFIEEKLEDAENMPSTTDKLSFEKLKSDNETMETALVKIELALRPPLGREKEVFQAGEIQFNDNVRLFAERALAKVRGNNEFTTEK